jgi:hypothetical protein
MSSLDTWPWCLSQSQYTDGFAVRLGTTCVSAVGTQIWPCCAAFLQMGSDLSRDTLLSQ